MRKEITFDRFIRGFLAVCGITIAILTLNYLSSILLPFFIAWILAYMLHPLVKFIQNKLHIANRVFCITLAILFVLVILTLLLALIIPPAITELMKFRHLVGEFINHNTDGVGLFKSIEIFLKEHVDRTDIMKVANERDLSATIEFITKNLWMLLNRTVDILMGFVTAFITLLYMFFILLDYDTLSKGWIKLIPSRNRDFMTTLANDVEKGMNAYFRGQALVAFLVGILFSIGFMIIDFPLAIGFGLFIGLLNLVPYLQLIGLIPTVLLVLIQSANTGENFWFLLFLALSVFVVVQIIQDVYLTPKIMGKITGLNPAIILLSLSVWGYILGIIGLIIALPLTTLILSYYRRYLEYEAQQQN